MSNSKTLVIRGNIVDIIDRRTYGAEVLIEEGRICRITPTGQTESSYLLPGFIDAHVHIESSMTVPAAFIRTAVSHGSIGAVADPHEIANVLGMAGVEFMLDNAKGLPFYSWFGAPSCVPATPYETAGATLNAGEVEQLLQRDDIHFLAEFMDYPGVLNKDPEAMQKIETAIRLRKPIDGHYPQATGDNLKAYIAAGISTDHETITLEEGREKCRLGIKVLIREGSAARDFDALHPLIDEYPEQIMFCTDDIHPSTLQKGYINRIVSQALTHGHDLYDVLRIASYNPARHYGIPAGFLQEGDAADFIRVNNLEKLQIEMTCIQGTIVYENSTCTIPFAPPTAINNFRAKPIGLSDLEIKAKGKDRQMRVIVCKDRDLITAEEIFPVQSFDGLVEPDTKRDLLKLVVVNRYQRVPPAIAFIKGTGLQMGAVAQSIAHDSHNIIAVGATDFELLQAINAVIRAKGGIAVSCMNEVELLPLPIAGLMSNLSLEETSMRYEAIEKHIRSLRTPMESLQMTLSFMSLLVIPSLKLSDKGLFDGETFQFTPLFV